MVVRKWQRPTIVFQGFFYATLDSTDPATLSMNEQTKALPLPDGWEVAPPDPEVIKNVISVYPWGCSALTVSDGSSVRTSVNHRRGSPGAIVSTHNLGTMKGELFIKDKSTWHHRILARIRDQELLSMPSLHEALESDTRFTDCTIVCAGEAMPCHRVVLANASPVFERMLTSEMREGVERRIEITDVEPSLVRTMLRVMYSAKVPDLQGDNAKLVDLMVLADRYEFQALAVVCAELLLETVDMDNVVKTVQKFRLLAHKLEFSELFKRLCAKTAKEPAMLEHILMKL